MSPALQIALFLASIAIVALVVCLIVVALLARRQLAQLTAAATQVQTDVQQLLRDSRELVRNVNTLSVQASAQMNDVGQVIQITRQWTERADRLAQALGALVEPPVNALLQKTNLLRIGLAAFTQVLLHRKRTQQTTEEIDHE